MERHGYDKWRKPIVGSCTLWDSQYLTFGKRQHCGDRARTCAAGGSCRGRGERTDHSGFSGRWNRRAGRRRTRAAVPRPKPTGGCTTPKVSLPVGRGPGVTAVCQCGRSDCNKRTSPVWEAGRGGGCVGMWVQGLLRKCLYLLLNFAVNLKLL